MCGIAGYLTQHPGNSDPYLLARMGETIRHRGPDEAGFYRDSFASLAHRRLSIIDLATGQQPMTNEAGNLLIVYNGEIFNHADLRRDLEKAGHRYRTRCDTETILHAYEEYGPACVNRFRGMFAFAIWDREARRLFCARDRLGKKPFYYYRNRGLFVFASEIKALLRHPEVSARFDESVLDEYLSFGYVSDERTLFLGIRKLMPAHHLTVAIDSDGLSVEARRYWEVPAAPAREEGDDAYWIRQCRERLEETVRMRLMSDVPLGMFLSGGVDSSAIAAILRRGASGPVKTFSVGYAEGAYSELPYARHVADAIGTEHHEIVVGMEDFFQALPRLIWHEDEPLVWPSSVSLYFVSQLASEHVKVVLTGEGSDEMFAGYTRYRHYGMNERWWKRYRLVPERLRRAIRGRVEASRLLSAGLRRKLQHTFLGQDGTIESLYLDNFYSAFPAAERSRLLAGDRAGGDGFANYLRYWNRHPDDPLLSRLLFADQNTYLVELLMKQDQMSMAASIESRVPFLDHEFVEFSTRVPSRLKLRGAEGKYIVKKAVEDLLPREIIYRRKMGFPTPVREWLRDARADRLLRGLADRDGFLAPYLDLREVEAVIGRQKSGLYDSTDRLWRVLNLQIWGDIFITGKQAEVGNEPLASGAAV